MIKPTKVLPNWKFGKRQEKLKNEIFELVKNFPKEERYRLTDQLIRSSISVGSNIAEGHGRFTFKDQIHFCIQASGSLSEVYHHLIDAMDCTYINYQQLIYFKNKIDDVEKILNGYINYLRKNLKQ